MTKKWISITLLLCVLTGLLGWRLYVSVKRFNAENDLSRIQPVRDIKQKTIQERSLPQLIPAASRNLSEFAAIPENNVFSETRTKEGLADGTSPTDPPPLTQKPILVATSIVDNQKRASIIDPTSPSQGRNMRSETKRIGDMYKGYTITDITATQIVLESGTRKEIISLHEGSKKQQSGKTPIVATRVVSIGGGSVSGGMPVVVVGSTPAPGRAAAAPAAPPAPAASPASGQPARILPVAVQQRTPAATGTPTQQTQPKQQMQQTQQQVSTTETDAQGRRIIRTPFGNIVRPNRE